MLVLAIDTAATFGGVLLAQNRSASCDPAETEVLSASLLEPRKASTQLIPAVAELLRTDRLTLASLDAIAIVSGPGSFTGLRVGLSAVKAMAEASSKPVIALSSLAMMACAAAGGVDADAPVHAVLDAGRGEFYHGIYRDAGWACESESFETLATLTARIEEVPGRVVVSEPATLEKLSGLKLPPCRLADVSIRNAFPLIFRAWQARLFVDIASLDANYLRSIMPAPVVGRAQVHSGAS